MAIPTTSFIPAASIDEVISRLDGIAEQAFVERDRLGFFAVVYRAVTAAVQRGIADGRFEDGPRMERLDVVFANRQSDSRALARDVGRPEGDRRAGRQEILVRRPRACSTGGLAGRRTLTSVE